MQPHITSHHGEQEERDTDVAAREDAAPHGLNPLATQHAEHDHERVQKVVEVPPGQTCTDRHTLCSSIEANNQ